MAKIRTYKMTHATGLAPNYDGGILTLAVCKPIIRRCAEVGDWIAGLTSVTLVDADGIKRGTPQGEEKLVFLMKVTDKMTFTEYWKRFPRKRPNKQKPYGLGDNIYCPTNAADGKGYEILEKQPPYNLVANDRHKTTHTMKNDLSADNVLISTEYRYFGTTHPLNVDRFKGTKETGVKVPYGIGGAGCISENDKVQKFIDYVMAQKAHPDGDYSQSHQTTGKGCAAKNK
jgi:hypothetical protein